MKNVMLGKFGALYGRHPELDSGSRCYKKVRFQITIIRPRITTLRGAAYKVVRRFGMTSLFNHGNTGGFTLIELLVVVLIIGILAAVAVPQYTQAVEKSRFATYRTLADSMVKAIEVFHLANGSWPTSLDELSMEFPADMSTENTIMNGMCWKNNKMFCCMISPVPHNTYGSIRCGDNESHLLYVRRYANDDGTPILGRGCSAKDEKYQSICKSISGTQTGARVTVATPSGMKSGYFDYTF